MDSCIHSCENCGCVSAKLGMITWICTKTESSEYLPSCIKTVEGDTALIKTERYFACKLYVNQAKIMMGNEISGLCK